MKYPVLVLRNNEEKNYLFSIVDLPGCKVKAATIDEGLLLLDEAMAAHLKILVEYGEQVPQAKTIEHHMMMSTATSPIWAILDFDIVPYMGKSHKINVTLPELLIKQIDDRVAKSPNYKTRSGFIAKACLAELG
ncbi:type II toxin-antitoxin system HicB family antitoxin [Cognaticolwellia aestuarii]|jgi:predicted RNase H-like HicB family nuclease|uniref:type II toxin-antitoxin system HicB family antitoxin n=1 Tax=Cognaticolwellia aestuarii TaxID=329993 RepID=UPI0009864BE8|nr:type II toxin-antitoxin system HicB family antitoxin [Cognaticolwellia aestuarii]|tara:strand:- start:506 stop:907 length:402 start_codon:yes stop_codon:yes gene_type:complete